MTTVSSACTCLEVFGEDPDCPLHSYDALEARIADLEELIEAQHGDVVVRTAKLLYEKDNKIAALSAEAERLRQERDEAINWTETVERHGTDGFDDLAEAWLALPAIQRTTNAAISTFARWANDDLMARFKKNQLSMFHLAFVEGCLAGVRAEAALSASNAEAERLRAATELMRKAHAVMRECGWQLAISAEPAGDGILEAACTEIEADFGEFLAARALQGSAKQ